MAKDDTLGDEDLDGVSGGLQKSPGRKRTSGPATDFGVGDVLGAEGTSCSCGCTTSGTWTSNKKVWTDNKKKG